MKKTSSAASLNFPPAQKKIFSEHGAEVDALPSLEYNEKVFNRILVLERKRSERSKRPFMLMLVSLERLPDGEIGSGVRAKILSCLASTKRDIDALGWYKSGSVAGIIFTEIGKSKEGSVAENITERIRSSLALNLEPDQIEKIDITICVFPENLQ